MLVVGHKNPDTDSVVAAIVMAQLQQKLNGQKCTPARAGELNNETKFVLRHFKTKAPRLVNNIAGQEVFLVDHNSPKESPAGREQAVLRGVLDHHYLCGLETTEPIYFRVKPVGSTSALVARFALQNKMKLTKTQAGLLLAGVLSDTLYFVSPTTTKDDEAAARELQKISGVKINQFAARLFAAKSSLSGIKLEEIISQDYKEFVFGGVKFGFGVWETVLIGPLLEKKEQLMAALLAQKKRKKFPYLFFAVVDILKNQSYWLITGKAEKGVVEEVFAAKEKGGIVFMPEIVSRKKQMIPPLAAYFNQRKK